VKIPIISDYIDLDETPEFRFSLFELSVQCCQRSQVSLQQVPPLQQEFAVKLAIFVWFFIKNANRSKYLAIGPNDRDPQVRDHPQFNIGVRLPLFVPESIGDQQRSPGVHHGLAIKSCIEGRDFVRLVRIPFGLAGYEHFDVGGLYSHYQGGGNMHDFGSQIHDLLPLSDDFRRYGGRMWHVQSGC
jgi:hypothetical protein